MRVSSGVWPARGISGNECIKGFQLWVAMPAALKLAEPESQNATVFHSAGPARVIANEYDEITSLVRSSPGVAYLDVRLRAGERWIYQPPRNHNVAWIASHQGTVSTASEVSAGEALCSRKARGRLNSRRSH
jgi:redox-sensitive bicupin YhaK (pirin superfamily)